MRYRGGGVFAVWAACLSHVVALCEQPHEKMGSPKLRPAFHSRSERATWGYTNSAIGRALVATRYLKTGFEHCYRSSST